MRTIHRIEEYALYFWEGGMHPLSTACWAPTSDRLIEELASYTEDTMENILEIGAGTGRLVRKLVERGHIGMIGAIELNERFCRFMEKTIDEPNVRIIHGRAEDLVDHCDDIFGKDVLVDRVYASIPLSIMHKSREQIIHAVKAILKDDGTFIVYIYRNIRKLLHRTFPRVDHWQRRNHWFSPWPYTIHVAHNSPSLTTPRSDRFASNGEATAVQASRHRWRW